jgi:hypothetical protein
MTDLVDELANELRRYRHSDMASAALAEHILAIPRIHDAQTTIEALSERIAALEGALNFDEPDAFEGWWQGYKHKNRDPANYTVKKCIAFDAFHEALQQARGASLTQEPQ